MQMAAGRSHPFTKGSQWGTYTVADAAAVVRLAAEEGTMHAWSNSVVPDEYQIVQLLLNARLQFQPRGLTYVEFTNGRTFRNGSTYVIVTNDGDEARTPSAHSGGADGIWRAERLLRRCPLPNGHSRRH